MKYRTTAKTIRNASGPKLALSYCSAQFLLKNHKPTAYTCGTYGWNFDVYELDCNHRAVTICMGYRGMVGKSPNYATLDYYERQAQRLWEDWERPLEERQSEIEELLHSWLCAALCELEDED